MSPLLKQLKWTKWILCYLFILPHHKYNENNKKRINNLTMARRPKGNYEVSSVTMYCVTR